MFTGLTNGLDTMSNVTFDLMRQQAQDVAIEPIDSTPIVDENHFFDFEKAKVQSLTLAQLKRTVRENDGKEGKPLHKIYHHDLIEQIMGICSDNGYQAEIYDMFATNNRDKMTPGVSLYPELEAKYGERAVEAHSIRRLFTNIRVRDFDTGGLTTNLAVSYTQKGIQIGIGRNVVICHNQCMLSADRYIADYSVGGARGERLEVADLLNKVRFWVENLRGIVAEDDEIIEKMKATKLTPAQVLLMIGMLTALRVKHDTSYKEISYRQMYPLNQAQICQFTERVLLEEHRTKALNLWMIYNAATDLYKPQTAEQSSILPQNLALMDFFRSNQLI